MANKKYGDKLAKKIKEYLEEEKSLLKIKEEESRTPNYTRYTNIYEIKDKDLAMVYTYQSDDIGHFENVWLIGSQEKISKLEKEVGLD